MGGGFVVFLFLAGVVAVIGLAVLAHMAAKQRRQMLAAWAEGRDWHYSEGKVSSLEDRFPDFGQLHEGDNRYGFNVMRGRVDHREAFAFDYHYQTYSTDSKGNRQTHHHEFSAIVIDSGLDLTHLRIRPEGIFDKVKGAFGFDDIDFESVEFSRAFWVTSDDKRWAYDVLNQRTMEFLLSSKRHPIELENGPHVIVWGKKKWRPAQFEDALGYADRILDGIPKDIRKELRNREDYPPPM